MSELKKNVVAIALLALGTVLARPEKAIAEASKCVTWDNAKNEIQQMYRTVGNPPIPDLPNGFKTGCVFYSLGASTITLYVLRDNISPQLNRLHTEPGMGRYSIPQLDPSKISELLNLIESGDMLRFFNVCSSAGTLEWCRGTPKNRAYVKDGLACFRNMCMQTNGVPNKDLLKLWNATKNQWPNL